MQDLEEIVCQLTGAKSCQLGDVIQRLWSDYGVIQRVRLLHSDRRSVIVKHIDLSQTRTNRRGWSGDISHQRKVRSYEIEQRFYRDFGSRCSDDCRIPKLIGAIEKPGSSGWLIVLEDLDESGFEVRKQHVTEVDVKACLKWLANFHAAFLGCEPKGLWPIGTYWHLDTRPDELAAMEPGPLRAAASTIDARLNATKFQTLVHGDAKLANFCFSSDGSNVAALDFQYVGGGCGMKDVAYLLSCLGDSESEASLNTFLDFYFAQLHSALLGRPNPSLDPLGNENEFGELEGEWRDLYRFAWADFCRFLAGWSPGHWKLNQYNDRLTQTVLKEVAEDVGKG